MRVRYRVKPGNIRICHNTCSKEHYNTAATATHQCVCPPRRYAISGSTARGGGSAKKPHNERKGKRHPSLITAWLAALPLCAGCYFMNAKHCRKRAKTALLKDESLSRALRCLHKAETTLTKSTQLLDTLEKRVALTAIVADLETLQRRLHDLLSSGGSPTKPSSRQGQSSKKTKRWSSLIMA